MIIGKGICVMLVTLFASPAIGTTFYDDFDDGDISDWEARCAPGIWQPSSGMVYGSTGNTPSALAPIDASLYENCAVSVSAKGGHAFGVIARLTDYETAVIAYVSPDADVARIRLVDNGGLSTILTSLSAPFPSNEWCDLTFTLDGSDLTFEIYVPSSGDNWTLNATDPSPQPGKFGLLMGDEPGAFWDWISVNGAFGEAPISWMTTVDVASGNGNMAFEAGEEIDLNIQLSNPSDEDLTGVFGVLQSLSSGIQITVNMDTFGTIPAGGTAWGNGGFGVFASSGTPEDEVYDLMLTIFADGGYTEQVEFGLPLGSGISSDVESGTENWGWDLVESGWQNNWHVSNTRNHTPTGSQSFKCGDTGGGDYDNDLYAYVATPLFNTPLEGEMTFWSWIDAQYLLDGEIAEMAYDGGMLQYGRCGTWIDLIPAGAYPYEIISGTTGPFEAGTGVFSGIAGWTEWPVTIPDSLAGPGQIRFVFGSDNSGTREGWYVDDIDVMGSTGVGSSTTDPVPGPSLQLWPNPFRGSITVSVTGVPEGPLSIEIFDLSGRLIASQEFGSTGSERSLLWDGHGSDGAIVPAGVYLIRLPGTEDLVQRIIRLE
jgi:hypothetical protein